MEDLKELHFHVNDRDKFKKLPLEGWFHPCFRCYAVTGYKYFVIVEDTKYYYNLCFGCSFTKNFKVMIEKINKYHKKIKLQEQNDYRPKSS